MDGQTYSNTYIHTIHTNIHTPINIMILNQVLEFQEVILAIITHWFTSPLRSQQWQTFFHQWDQLQHNKWLLIDQCVMCLNLSTDNFNLNSDCWFQCKGTGWKPGSCITIQQVTELQRYRFYSDQIIHGVIIVSILKTLLLTLKKNKCLTRI